MLMPGSRLLPGASLASPLAQILPVAQPAGLSIPRSRSELRIDIVQRPFSSRGLVGDTGRDPEGRCALISPADIRLNSTTSANGSPDDPAVTCLGGTVLCHRLQSHRSRDRPMTIRSNRRTPACSDPPSVDSQSLPRGGRRPRWPL